MRSVALVEFKKSLRDKGATLRDSRQLPTLRKSVMAKTEEAAGRRIKYTISTNAVDLDNDTVNQAGWDLSVYRTNPLVLWMHDNEQLPIAKCVAIGLEGGKLKATAEFVPPSMPVIGAMADAVYQMSKAGFLSATSVGFLPLDFDLAADRMGPDDYLPPVNFKQQRLLEFSIVTVPANSEALIDPSERDGAVAPPVEMRARAMSEAARLTTSRAFERHRRLSFLADLGIPISLPSSKKSGPAPSRAPAGSLTMQPRNQIRSAQEAMAAGLTNAEIRKLADKGQIPAIPENYADAVRQFWRSDDLIEARRRGLFY